MPSGVLRLGAAGLFLGLSACGVFPGDTNFAALDVDRNEIYVGALSTMFGEPTGGIAVRGQLTHVLCQGVAGAGKVGTEAEKALIVRCEDGRIIRGNLHYESRTTGFGSGRDTRQASYRFLFGYSNGTEAELRAAFAVLAAAEPTELPSGAVSVVARETAPIQSAAEPHHEAVSKPFDISHFEDDDGIDRAAE